MIKIILLFAITILLISLLFHLIRNRDECIDKIEGYQSSLSDNFNKLKDTTAKGFGIIKDKVSNKFNIVKDKVVDKTNDITININDKLNDTINKTNEQEKHKQPTQDNKREQEGQEQKQKYIMNDDLTYLNSYIESSL